MGFTRYFHRAEKDFSDEQWATLIELEAYAFDLVNTLCDDYGLCIDDYTGICYQIWEESTEQGMKSIIRFLQTVLLDCMYCQLYYNTRVF